VDEGVHRLTVDVRNESQPGSSAERVLGATHVILGVASGAFVSLVDPPAELAALAATCENRGTWPVLVGAGSDVVLSSPIILEERPAIAPESPGDLFDATEIDEILTLRILTLTDAEKQAMRADPRARALLERTESLSAHDLMKLHGRGRPTLCAGDRVRLRPRARGDVFDLALAGRSARVAAVEHDLEGRVHVAVTIDDDPGRDLGAYGHRFFFGLDEVERIEGAAA
jgi:hypothetical protein